MWIYIIIAILIFAILTVLLVFGAMKISSTIDRTDEDNAQLEYLEEYRKTHPIKSSEKHK